MNEEDLILLDANKLMTELLAYSYYHGRYDVSSSDSITMAIDEAVNRKLERFKSEIINDISLAVQNSQIDPGRYKIIEVKKADK